MPELATSHKFLNASFKSCLSDVTASISCRSDKPVVTQHICFVISRLLVREVNRQRTTKFNNVIATRMWLGNIGVVTEAVVICPKHFAKHGGPSCWTVPAPHFPLLFLFIYQAEDFAAVAAKTKVSATAGSDSPFQGGQANFVGCGARSKRSSSGGMPSNALKRGRDKKRFGTTTSVGPLEGIAQSNCAVSQSRCINVLTTSPIACVARILPRPQRAAPLVRSPALAWLARPAQASATRPPKEAAYTSSVN